MNKYNNLLIKIANELNIKKGNNEPELQYKSRIIYSAISRLGYSSLWDKLEDDIPVSIIHFKQRIKNVLNSYLIILQNHTLVKITGNTSNSIILTC